MGELTWEKAIVHKILENHLVEGEIKPGRNREDRSNINCGAFYLTCPRMIKIDRGSNAYVLPVPMFLYICGGKLAATDLDFQEFNVMPIGDKTFAEAIRMGSEVYHILGKMLPERIDRIDRKVI